MPEDVTNKEWCPACGLHHEENVRPTICHNLIELVTGLRAWLDGEDDEGQDLLATCDEILGETDDDDDDDEVFDDDDEEG